MKVILLLIFKLFFQYLGCSSLDIEKNERNTNKTTCQKSTVDECYERQYYFLLDLTRATNQYSPKNTTMDISLMQEMFIESFLSVSQSSNFLRRDQNYIISDDIIIILYSQEVELVLEGKAFKELSTSYSEHHDFGRYIASSQLVNDRVKHYSKVSYAFEKLLSDLYLSEKTAQLVYDAAEQYTRPFIFLLTAGLPESKLGFVSESKRMNDVVIKLRKQFKVQIHCVLIALDSFATRYWQKASVCDSTLDVKSIKKLTKQTISSKYKWALERKELCETMSNY